MSLYRLNLATKHPSLYRFVKTVANVGYLIIVIGAAVAAAALVLSALGTIAGQ